MPRGPMLSVIPSRRSTPLSISGRWLKEVERIAPRPDQPKGGRPPYPTEAMVRVLVITHLHGLSDGNSVPVDELVQFTAFLRLGMKRHLGKLGAANDNRLEG